MLIKFKHPEYGLIVKATLEWGANSSTSRFEPFGVQIKDIHFGLPTKASKLEKLLLKYVEMYAYDVFRNNMYNVIKESKEYKKFAEKDHSIPFGTIKGQQK